MYFLQTYYSLQKVWGKVFHSWGYTRESWTYPTSWFSCLNQTQTKKLNLWLTPRKLCKCSQISRSSSRVESTPNRTKTNHHCLTIYKYSTHAKLSHLARVIWGKGLKLSSSLTKENLGLIFPLFFYQHRNHKSWMVRCSLRTQWF